jgi:copper(I)-binding protein
MQPRSASTALRVLVAMTVAVLSSGCSAAHQQNEAGGASVSVATAPGRLSVHANGNVDGPHLDITQASVRLGPQGTGELTMTVQNNSGAPDHLVMVSTANAAQVIVQAATPSPAKSTDTSIPLPAGSTTVFGAEGPRLLLVQVHNIVPGQAVPFSLVFGLEGLVHLTAVAQSP